MRDHLIELRGAVEGLIAADHDDLARDLLALVVGGAPDADVDDGRRHLTRPAIGEALGRRGCRADGQAGAPLLEQRHVERLTRGREAGGAEGALEPARLLAPCRAARRLGAELRAGAHLGEGDVGRVGVGRGGQGERCREGGEAPDREEVHAERDAATRPPTREIRPGRSPPRQLGARLPVGVGVLDEPGEA